MIELKNIVCGYGKKNVISSLSFDIAKGKLSAVVGPNGSGKSTLLKSTVGILPVTSGIIMIDGVDFAALSRKEKAKKISYLAQGKSVPEMSVLQMVLHGRFPHLNYPRCYSTKDIEIAQKAIAHMGLTDLSDKQLGELSGGTRQKAFIAMALAQDTDYILLDEPTTYLDISAQLELMRILRALADAGKGVVMVMHDLSMTLSFADEILILSNGCARANGTPKDLVDQGVIKEVFGVDVVVNDYGTYSYKY